MKRFTETTKWSQPWFRKLTPTAKLLYQFLNDNCDNAGVVDPDFELASFQIGQPVDEKNVTEFTHRVQRLDNGKLWLPDFIQEQFGSLTGASNLHRSVIKLIQDHNLPHPIPSPCHRQGMAMPLLDHSEVIFSHPVGVAKGPGKGKGKGKVKAPTKVCLVGQPSALTRGLVAGKNMNGNFQALKLANRIIANQTGWHYDNCKVDSARLKSPGLQTVIEPFVEKFTETQIMAAWAEAVRLAHGAKVDRLARDATAYAVACFKRLLQEKGNPTP